MTLADLQEFAGSLDGLEPASRYRCLSSVKSLRAFSHRIGYLPFDVGRVLRLPSVRNSLAERILSEADLHRLLSLEADERNRVLLLLLYASGVRRGEVAELRWRDLQATGESGQIIVFGKGGKTRSIQLPDSIWKQLQKLRGDGGVDDALDRGVPIHLVQATLGQASIATTGRYLHARPKESSSKFLPL